MEFFVPPRNYGWMNRSILVYAAAVFALMRFMRFVFGHFPWLTAEGLDLPAPLRCERLGGRGLAWLGGFAWLAHGELPSLVPCFAVELCCL